MQLEKLNPNSVLKSMGCFILQKLHFGHNLPGFIVAKYGTCTRRFILDSNFVLVVGNVLDIPIPFYFEMFCYTVVDDIN